MKGGTYIVEGNTEKDVSKIIFSLLQNPAVKITILSYESLYGFVFEIVIPNEDTPFREHDENGIEYNVTRLIIKFVLLVNDNIRRKYQNIQFGDKTVTKDVVNVEALENEAKTQNTLWRESFVYMNRKPLCNPVIFCGSLNNDSSKLFIQQLCDKVGESNEIASTIKTYVINQFTNDNTLYSGILVMPNSGQNDNAKTLAKALKEYNDPNRMKQVYLLIAECTFVVINLYMKSNLVLLDGHAGNFMVAADGEDKFNVTIIDLDKTVEVLDKTIEVELYNGSIPTAYDIGKIMKIIEDVELKNSGRRKSQMGWYYLWGDSSKNLINETVGELFKKIRTPLSDLILPKNSINFKFTDVSSDFDVSAPAPAIVTVSEPGSSESSNLQIAPAIVTASESGSSESFNFQIAPAPAIVTLSEPGSSESSNLQIAPVPDKFPDNVLAKISSLDENQKKQIYANVVTPYLELLRAYAKSPATGGKKTKRRRRNTKTTRKYR